MIFEENSGLATVVPHSVIQEAIKVAVDKLKPGRATVKEQEKQVG